MSREQYGTKEFLNDLLAELTEASISTPQGSNIDVVTFANSILFNDSPSSKLWPTQEAILKAIYNEPLSDTHKAILALWKEQNKTNWVEGRKYTNLIFEAGRGCPVATSEIITSAGTITYKELHDRSTEAISIYTIDPASFVLSTTSNFRTWDQGLQSAHKLKLKNGKEEQVTSDHPYLVWRNAMPEWIAVKDLVKGDRVAVLNNLPLFGNKSIGIERAKQLAKSIASSIPTCIKEAPKEEVAAFLSCLFSCNGFVSTKKSHKRYLRPSIGIASLHETLVLDIQKELVKFGIRSKVRYTSNKRTPNRWALIIEDANSILEFAASIGMLSKQDKLNEAIHRLKHIELDTIPKPVWQRIKQRQAVLELTNKQLSGKNRLRSNGSLTKRNARAYAANTYDTQLLSIVDSAIDWEEVSYVQDLGLQPIIGFEVQDTHVIGNYIVSHNSSKSTLSSIISLYEFYRLISLPDPGLHYGLLSYSPIALFAIAQTEAQVLETSFKAIKSFLDSSDFFKSMIKKKRIIVLSDEIKCPDKFVSLFAKHTNSKALVGYNLKMLFIDEMARFETTADGVNTGINIYENVGRALNRFKGEGKKIVVSSAWSFTDPMVTLKEQVKGDPYSLVFELSCFDVNPTITRSNPDIVSDYASNPKRARLEYENIRSSSDNSFLDAALLDKLCIIQSRIDATECSIDIDNRSYRGISIDRIDNVNTACFIHVDTGSKKDSTALSIATINSKGQIEVIGIACWTPGIDEKGRFREVSYVNTEEVILYISQYMNVVSITFDGWNSISLNQNLYVKGLNTNVVSFSRDSQLTYYTLLRQLIQQGDVLFPVDSPWTALIKTDLPSLVIKDNGKIVHPYGTKDLPDALAVSVFEAYRYGCSCNLIHTRNANPPKLLTINTDRKVINNRSSINRLQSYKQQSKYRTI
jgi:hypothetical protein